ncbi:MAG TPA: hypothetical protein VHK03_08205 [Aestuariivirgaceae bacterium]|nr:hypothetical protein [Aestuariivirgaceae bacterium]
MRLTGQAQRLWQQFIAPAYWLTIADSPKAVMWCFLQAEFEAAPAKMIASRIAQVRALGSELGLDPSSRARLGASVPDADVPQREPGKPTLKEFLASRPSDLIPPSH